MRKSGLTENKAIELIQRETGITAQKLEQPEVMNHDPEWPYYRLQSGNMRIDVYQTSTSSFLEDTTLTALSVHHENSSSSCTEYYYTDSLEYAPEYTNMERRENRLDFTGDKDNDPVYKRLHKDAATAIWQHFRKFKRTLPTVERTPYNDLLVQSTKAKNQTKNYDPDR